MIKNLFYKPTPEELFKKWRSDIRSQERSLNRQLMNIEKEENKVKTAIKATAKRNDLKSCKILAKEVVQARKHKQRIHTSKAQLNSILMQLQHQVALSKMAGTLKKSTEVMKLVNNLVKLPEISVAMMELSKELTKSGIIEEMMEDTLETLDDADLEDEAEEEVNQVLLEMTNGLFGEATKVKDDVLELPEVNLNEVDEAEELEDMRARLSALKS